jgi:FtsZ-interacting cell division protein YlmF
MAFEMEFAPRQFPDLEEVARTFCDGLTVAVDMTTVEAKDRRRFADFLSGLAYGRGEIHHNDKRFVLTPAS